MKSALTLLLFGASLLLPTSLFASPCAFRIDVLDIGQGDATLIQAPDCKATLIDGGDVGSGKIIRSHLESLGIRALDRVIVTHYHQDHLAGIVELGQGTPFPVGQVLDRGGLYNSATYSTYDQIYGGRRVSVTAGEIYSLGEGVKLKVVASNGNGTGAGDENSLSVAMKITYGELDMFLGGDLTGFNSGDARDVEGRIAADIGPVEVYHVNHHGSAESSNNTLLSVLQPDVSLISVGWDNTYGHPTPQVMDRIDALGSMVYMTEDPAQGRAIGPISVYSANGLTFEVEQAGVRTQFATRADDPEAVEKAVSMNILRGLTVSTDPAPLQNDDSSLWTLTSNARGGLYQTDWTADFLLADHTPTSLSIVYNGRYSTSRVQTLQAWIPASQAWEVVGSANLGSSEQTLYYPIDNPARLIDANGAVRLRVTADARTSSYKCYADALFVVWEP